MFRKLVCITITQLSRTEKYVQLSIKEGIRRHGDKALEAVLKEYSQLDDKEMFDPQNAKRLNQRSKTSCSKPNNNGKG